MMEREYAVARIESAPDWTRITEAELDKALWLPDGGIAAWAQLAYDDTALYVRMRAREPEPRAAHHGLCDAVAEDSCLEWFFCPRPGDDCYFNFEWNGNGALYLGFGRNMREHARQIVPKPKELFQFRSFSEGDVWGVAYRVPFRLIRRYAPEFCPAKGTVLRGNFYKCGDRTKQPHYLAWNAVESATPDFHRPDQFGILRF